MWEWILAGCMVLVTIFVAGFIAGSFLGALSGLERGVAGFSSMANWRFW